MFEHLKLRVVLPALIISLGGGFHIGYQYSVLNPSENTFKNFINQSYHSHYGGYLTQSHWSYLQPILALLQNVGGFIGTFFINRLLDALGRKKSFYVTNAIMIASCAMFILSKYINAWELFLMGRLINGLGQGIQVGLQPVYLNEISPKSIRGFIGSATGCIVEGTFLLASIIAMPIVLGNETMWPYLFVIEAIPSVVALFVLPFLPESPKYMASIGDYKGAEKSLEWFGRNPQEVTDELNEIREELVKDSYDKSQSMSLRTLFSIPHVRKGVFLGWMIVFTGATSGIVALGYFSATILQNNGIAEQNAQYGTIGICGMSFIGALLSGLIIDKMGRRKIVLITNSALLLLNVLFVIFGHLSRVYMITWASYANLVVSPLISFTFGLGPGVITWLLTAELVPQKARSTANSLAMFSYWLCNIIAVAFFPLQSMIYEFFFLLHLIPLIISMVYFAIALPETKNRSILEIMRDLGYTGAENTDEVADETTFTKLNYKSDLGVDAIEKQ